MGDLVRYMTASFGITALDEATYPLERQAPRRRGRRLSPPPCFATCKEKHQRQFKKEDDHLYAIYGTPGRKSLCATQAQSVRPPSAADARRRERVPLDTPHYSPEYFTNSFHVNVTEDITPFEKQDREFTDFHLCEGGHIQYVRLDNPENIGGRQGGHPAAA